MTTPFPFQAEDARRIESFGGRTLLASDPGVGKSLISLLYGTNNPSLRPIVVVCPASVKWSWSHEAKIHFGMRSEVLETTKPPKGGLSLACPITIINYDILRPWMAFLKGLRPQIVVLDECHYLGSRTSLRTRMARELCRAVPHVLALSGTPLVNRPAELWPTLNIVRPDLWPSFFPFALKHCSPRKTQWGTWECKGAEKLPQLHSQLSSELMIRRRKADVLKDLPAKRRIRVPLPLSDPSEYRLAESDFRSWLREHAPGRLKSAIRAEALTQLGELKRLAARLKLPAATEWIDNWLASGSGKLVVFAVHKFVVARLMESYKGIAVKIDGSTSSKKRRLAVERFRNDKKCRLLVGNIQAAGVGINLQVASEAVFVELAWTPGAMTQAEARIHRIGSKSKVTYWYLLGVGTVEERILALIRRKQKVLTAVLDNGDGEGFDIVEELAKEIRKGE